MKKIIIIAPHADDEILGLGGTISKYVENSFQVVVLIMTNASIKNPKRFPVSLIKKIRKEAEVANKFIGVSKLVFYDFPALDINDSYIGKIADTIQKDILKYKPTKVFIPSLEDIHSDHKVIHQACLVACRPINNFKIQEVLSYETLSETEWGITQFNPNKYEILKKKHLLKKINAFKKYKTQIQKNFHPRSENGIKSLSKYRGTNISVEYAEAFKIIRNIN
tara:strand:+ start:430 stop:1095 length:666 start_codon:yes stop_codon:yes gene_type:complete